jgi:hypothetical protein
MYIFILILAFFFSANAQPLFKLEINHSFVWGFNHSWGEIWKSYFREDETNYNFDYGFIKTGNLRFSPYLIDNAKISVGYNFPKFQIWFGWQEYSSYNASLLNVQSNEDEIYYVRLWDSVLFPLLNTDYPQYAGPQTLASFQSIKSNNYYLSFNWGNFVAQLNYQIQSEQDGVRLDEEAKIFDYFFNHVTIRDLSTIKRYFYGVEFGINWQIFLLKWLNFVPYAGIGGGYEKAKISNQFIDIDDGYYYSKFDNRQTPFYYQGLVAQNLTLKNFQYYFKFSPIFEIKLDKNAFIGSGIHFVFYPNYYVRYNLIFPWGVGLDTNAKTGMKWEWQRNSVVIIHLNLFYVKVKL